MSGLALIAGEGVLPAAIVAALDSPAVICAPEGVGPAGLSVQRAFRFERLVPFLNGLRADGIDRVVLAGNIHRPRLDPAAFDPETAAQVPRFLSLMQGGDDSTLRAVIALLEDFDLTVLGVADVAPDLLVRAGTLTRAPNAREEADAARGREVLDLAGPADIGQACVVAARLCLGMETLYGTDALLSYVASHRECREPRRGGVLVKRAKPAQDLRLDLPTIGPATIDGAVAAGLTGICLEAGRTLIVDRAQVLARAQAADLALWATT